MAETPTIYEWAGGTAAFERWLNTFYDMVEEEGSLAPLFGGTVSERHREHALAWWIEVMGGADDYSRELGGYPAMLAHHRGLRITPELGIALAVHNSGADAEVVEEAPVPRWGWGVAPPFEG